MSRSASPGTRTEPGSRSWAPTGLKVAGSMRWAIVPIGPDRANRHQTTHTWPHGVGRDVRAGVRAALRRERDGASWSEPPVHSDAARAVPYLDGRAVLSSPRDAGRPRAGDFSDVTTAGADQGVPARPSLRQQSVQRCAAGKKRRRPASASKAGSPPTRSRRPRSSRRRPRRRARHGAGTDDRRQVSRSCFQATWRTPSDVRARASSCAAALRPEPCARRYVRPAGRIADGRCGDGCSRRARDGEEGDARPQGRAD